MFEYITHYYHSVPFRSLSALSRSEAMKVMEELSDDSPIFERFKEPVQYWENRLEAENWLRNGFKEKGGVPNDKYPIYAVLGTGDWIENYALSEGIDLNLLRIPLSLFSESDISFTLPDSMVSFWIGRDKPEEYYNAKFHGQVFTLSEINEILTADIMSNLESMIPNGIPYVEAQIWNHEIAMNFYNNQKINLK